jgi:ATP-binding cassette subfamily B protein
VLLRRPSLLLLDEPTAGLDDEQASKVLERCLSAAGGAGIILLTHRLAETATMDRVYELDGGVLRRLSEHERAELLR